MTVSSMELLGLHFDPQFSTSDLHSMHRQFGEQFPAVPAPPLQARGGKLRIGYVSGDFYAHACANFLLPIIKTHDRSAFEVFLYSNKIAADDIVTEQFRRLGAWRQIHGVDDAAVCAQIAEDKIDILVDCSGHSGGKRMGIFAKRPAPISATFLGYPNTTGLTQIDYRLTDDVSDPMIEGNIYATEQLIRLPNGVHTYAPHADVDLAYSPTPPFLRKGHVTFGSFNRREKVNDEVLAVWTEILKAVPGSRLLLKGDTWRGSPIFTLEYGRVAIMPKTPMLWHHYAAYAEIDIALDTFPYNGTTTTCDALWMGVPVVTFKGDRHAARMTASLLSRMQLDDLIAEDMAGYVAKAVALATDKSRLAELRRTIRPRFMQSPLGRPEIVTRDLEAFYQKTVRERTSLP